MNLGDKISSLRKKNNFSQEDLADKVGVTRQTISKWELSETAPDINQAKTLSKIFNISLDELVCNDLNNLLVEKVSNTEKLAGIIIKILKVIGICMILFVVFIIASFILFTISFSSSDRNVSGEVSLSCNLDDQEYLYSAQYNKNFQILYSGGDAWISNHIDISRYEDANEVVAHIDDYFKDHDGSCNINWTDK